MEIERRIILHRAFFDKGYEYSKERLNWFFVKDGGTQHSVTIEILDEVVEGQKLRCKVLRGSPKGLSIVKEKNFVRLYKHDNTVLGIIEKH